MSDRLDKVKGQTRSYSQIGAYERCPYAYYLDRVQQVWNEPASWLAHGSAVHEACEKWERTNRIATKEQARAWFREAYSRELQPSLDETPNLSFWSSSGPYKGPEDVVRRWKVGQEHVDRYIDFYTDVKTHNQVIWIDPNGTPAIELDFDVDLDGVRVRGFIDAIIDHPKKGLIIRDTKTGQTPGDTVQLKIYAQAVEELHGVEVSKGDFFMTKRGTPTRTSDLSTVSRQEVVDSFHAMDQAVKDEKFDPKPGPACERCTVKTSCAFSV